jgi:integrase
MSPHEIIRADIRAFLKEKAKSAPYMANRILEVIRRVYSWGVEEERVAASPCVGLKKAGIEKERERVLSTEELRKVMEAIDRERPMIAGFFRLALLTGARRGEILGARWRDVDFEERLLTFPDTKNNTAHTVPLSESAVRVLRELHPLAGHTEWIFLGPTGGAIQNPQKAVGRLRKKTGIEFRIHDLRRTVATGLARLGVPRDVISSVLGHIIAGPQATRIYDRHARIPEMRHALDRWARDLERIRTSKTADVVSIVG